MKRGEAGVRDPRREGGDFTPQPNMRTVARGAASHPTKYVARVWAEEPNRFKIDPYRYSSGLNT
jgi:hypothetical protein